MKCDVDLWTLTLNFFQEFGRVESSVTTKIKGITKSQLDADLPYEQGKVSALLCVNVKMSKFCFVICEIDEEALEFMSCLFCLTGKKERQVL